MVILSSMKEETIEKFRKLVAEQGDTLGRLLDLSSRAIPRRILDEHNKKEPEHPLSLSQFYILQSLCLQGMKSTDLANRVGISKQAVGQAVSELEKKGYVEKIPHPSDSRARIVQHTEQGYQLISDLIDATIKIEEHYSELFGREKYAEFKRMLGRLLE